MNLHLKELYLIVGMLCFAAKERWVLLLATVLAFLCATLLFAEVAKAESEIIFSPTMRAYMQDKVVEYLFEEEAPLVRGIAGWYGKRFHGCVAKDGSMFNMFRRTFACNELPFGYYIVRDAETGRVLIAKNTDWGSFGERYGRVADLSMSMFDKLNDLDAGLTTVEIYELNKENLERFGLYKSGIPDY